MELIPEGTIDSSIKVYFQVASLESEMKMMELFEHYSPSERTFSSLMLTLRDPRADLDALVAAITPLIDALHDSVVLLYCCEGEDLILDLGVTMKVEYS